MNEIPIIYTFVCRFMTTRILVSYNKIFPFPPVIKQTVKLFTSHHQLKLNIYKVTAQYVYSHFIQNLYTTSPFPFSTSALVYTFDVSSIYLYRPFLYSIANYCNFCRERYHKQVTQFTIFITICNVQLSELPTEILHHHNNNDF